MERKEEQNKAAEGRKEFENERAEILEEIEVEDLTVDGICGVY